VSGFDIQERSNIVLAGVGGQGIILAGRLLLRSLQLVGKSALMNEIHGMAQRGGVVTANLRYGPITAPMVPAGEADVILGFEPMESLRVRKLFSPHVKVITSITTVKPRTLKSSPVPYPELETIIEELKGTSDLYTVDTKAGSTEVGNPKVGNLILLGSAVKAEAVPFSLDDLHRAIDEIVPEKFREVNHAAVNWGAEHVQHHG